MFLFTPQDASKDSNKNVQLEDFKFYNRVRGQHTIVNECGGVTERTQIESVDPQLSRKQEKTNLRPMIVRVEATVDHAYSLEG